MMNITYEMPIFYLILVLGIAITIYFTSKAEEWQSKLINAFLLVGTTVYSGLGISSRSVDNSYIVFFILFLVFEGMGLKIGESVMRQKGESHHSNAIEIIASTSILITTLAILYWGIIVFLLVYPDNHLGSLFSVRLDISGVFENRIAKRTNSIVYMLGLVSMLILPFYSMYLAKQSKAKIVCLLFLETYLKTVTDGYIGRTSLMVLIVEIVIILMIINTTQDRRKRVIFRFGNIKIGNNKNSEEPRESNKRLNRALVIVIVGFIIAIPFLASYQFTRQGKTFNETGFLGAFKVLLDSEINYPMHYAQAEYLIGSVITPLEYLYWLITLPIPKEIISLPSAISINTEFSSILTGIGYGGRGFSISLVSLMGEGILLWGKYFCFFHGFTLGFLWGVMNGYLSRHKELLIFQIIFIAKTLNMVRGGSQGSIAAMGNSIIPFIIVVYVVHNISKHKRAVV